MQAEDPDIRGLRGEWTRVKQLPPGNALSVLGTALQAQQEPVTLLQAGADNSALITSVASIEAVAQQKPEIEVHDLPSDVEQTAFLSADQSATRDLLEWLTEVRMGAAYLLGTITADPLKAGTVPSGLRAQPTEATVAIRAESGKIEFSVYKLSPEDSARRPMFQPVKERIGEPIGNLAQRSEWFKRRTGH
jgi:hypothetical protein